MKILIAFALTLFVVVSAAPAQQITTGAIQGTVTDATGGVLPGATVDARNLETNIVDSRTTDGGGRFVFLQLRPGRYTVTVSLAGMTTFVQEEIVLTVGQTVNLLPRLSPSAVQETVTVTGESPLIDTKATGTKSTFDLETLQNIPSARDPWVMLERSPGITMDRVNVGGNQSGQQSGYISRGSSTGNNKWSIDGVDITDMAATGASPIYYDVDMLEEMQVTTGGADASQQTGGVGINLVTRGGTDRFRGSGRLYVTDDNFRATTSTRASPPRAPARRFRTSRTTASRSAARSSGARPGTGAATARRTSASAWSASTRPRPAAARRRRRPRRCAPVSRPT
jgi:hypothetical protein